MFDFDSRRFIHWHLWSWHEWNGVELGLLIQVKLIHVLHFLSFGPHESLGLCKMSNDLSYDFCLLVMKYMIWSFLTQQSLELSWYELWRRHLHVGSCLCSHLYFVQYSIGCLVNDYSFSLFLFNLFLKMPHFFRIANMIYNPLSKNKEI